VREFCATNVPYGAAQDQRFLRDGWSAVSSRSAKWMKTRFKLPRNGSVSEPLQADPLAGYWTVCRSLTRIVSTTFQLQIPLHPGPRKERGICRPAVWTTPVSGSATETDEREGFQPSMLCNRSLPIYFSGGRAVPPTS
jgi:hypothetical protein